MKIQRKNLIRRKYDFLIDVGKFNVGINRDFELILDYGTVNHKILYDTLRENISTTISLINFAKKQKKRGLEHLGLLRRQDLMWSDVATSNMFLQPNGRVDARQCQCDWSFARDPVTNQKGRRPHQVQFFSSI